jgi:cell division protein FtsI/penicillin-binding protein 2
MDVTEAMGKSVNPIYGRIASDLLGKERLKQTCNNFGFNRPLLLPGVPAVPSPAPAVETSNELRLQGCGLDHGLQVSPIHAAAITAAIANRGSMMAPRLVDQATRNGKELKVPATRELAKVISPETADSLTRMLLTTVTSGTSRKAFHSSEGRRLTSGMKIAAKTGSIDGNNPKGHYSWFAAYAPADQPRIALVALVINGDKWKIKASQLGEQALAEFFRQGK